MEKSLVIDVVYLMRSAWDEVAPHATRIASMDLDAVYRMAKRHMVSSACGMALKAAGIVRPDFDDARGKAIRKVAAMDIERERLFSRMDGLGIWYMPLKGCVLQDLYPAYGMREMSDNDILFDGSRADEVRHIMESMGFVTVHFDRVVHDIYHKEPVCNFEMHRKLFDEAYGQRFCEYYRDIERLLIPDGDGTMGMHLRDEDFYVYLLAHEHKHYAAAGTGLRSLLDLYVFLQKKCEALDWTYIKGELEKLGLVSFERSNRELAMHLFGGGELTVADCEMLDYVVESGVYGTTEHNIANGVKTYGSLGFLFRRAFPAYGEMSSMFPVLKRFPVLLPACWTVRLYGMLAHKRGSVLSKLKIAFGKEGEQHIFV